MHQRNIPAGGLASSASTTTNKITISVIRGLSALMVLLAFLSVPSARAQIPTIQFGLNQNRITVPVNSSNSTIIANSVSLSNGATNANFDVSGLPVGATYVL